MGQVQVSSKSECEFQRYPWLQKNNTPKSQAKGSNIIRMLLKVIGEGCDTLKARWAKFHQNPSASSRDIHGCRQTILQNYMGKEQ